MAPIEVPESLSSLARAFEKQGWPLYAVGGWCRDRLLGLPAHDADGCGPAGADAVLARFENDPGLRAIPQAQALGTVLLLAGDGTRMEYTAFRRESYRRATHRPDVVKQGATLMEDALRRDFTVNALYVNLMTGAVCDPTGGLADLQARRLRTPRDPRAVFDEDGLRLMRLARLACELDFTVEDATFSAAAARAANIDCIVPQRVGQEMERILLADTRYPGPARPEPPPRRGLALLDALGVLERILPEVTAGRAVAQRREYHDHDVLEHLLRSCGHAPPRLALRWAALLHDIGKPVCAATGSMVGHDRLGAAMADAVLRRMACPAALRHQVTALVRWHMFDLTGRARDRTVRRFFAQRGYGLARDLIDLRRADVAGSREDPAAPDPAARWEAILGVMQAQGVPDTVEGVRLSGDRIADILGEPPSPRVGRMKRALWLYVVDHPQANEPQALARQARRLARDPSQWDRPPPGGPRA